MSRALLIVVAALVAAPAFAQAPAPASDAPPPPAKERPRGKDDRATKKADPKAGDLRARPGAGGAKDPKDAPRQAGTPAPKPPPCVEVKPCPID
jgi:hypothetical protein